ncbi:MAG TPA: WD40 repeat domain-containing protein [Planctomycetota bacterium]|nr:WD40 repeat domain-containing protein [Planctomycetota bacterium]
MAVADETRGGRRKRRLALSIGALVLLGLIGAFVVELWKSGERVLDAGGSVHDLVFSTDGSRVAAVTDAGLFREWSVETGALVRERNLAHDPATNGAVLSPALDIEVVSLPGSNDLQVLDIDTGRVVSHVNVVARSMYYRLDEVTAFAADGRSVAIGDDTGVRIWATPSMKLLREIRSPPCENVAITRSGMVHTIVKGTSKPQVWSPSGKLLRELDAFDGSGVEYRRLGSSGDGETVAVVTQVAAVPPRTCDGRIEVFRASDGEAILRLSPGEVIVNKVMLSESGDLVAVKLLSMRGWQIYSVPSGRHLATRPMPGGVYRSNERVVFSPTAPLLAHDHGETVHLVPLGPLGRWRNLQVDGSWR